MASSAHPAFAAFIAPVVQKYKGHIAVGQALNLVGKKFDDLPILAGYVDPKGKSKICWVHVMTGRCPYGDKCRHPNEHIPNSAMTTNFMQLAVALLQPAMELYMLKPHTKRRKAGG